MGKHSRFKAKRKQDMAAPGGEKNYVLYSYAIALSEKPTYVCRQCQNQGKKTEAAFYYRVIGTGKNLHDAYRELHTTLSQEELFVRIHGLQIKGYYPIMAAYGLCAECMSLLRSGYVQEKERAANLVTEAQQSHSTIVVAQHYHDNTLRIGQTDATDLVPIIQQLEAATPQDGILEA